MKAGLDVLLIMSRMLHQGYDRVSRVRAGDGKRVEGTTEKIILCERERKEEMDTG